MDLNKSIGILTMRLLLGFIILMQGFGKVFTWGVDNIAQSEMFAKAYEDLLPNFVITATAYYTSYVELIAGVLLVIGFKINLALYAMASVLVIVTFGHGLTAPVWDLSHVMYRAILLVGLLLLPRAWDRFSVDQWLVRRKG